MFDATYFSIFVRALDIISSVLSIRYFQLLEGLEKAYVISSTSELDINNLLKALGIIRSLLLVQAGPDEEELMKNSLK